MIVYFCKTCLSDIGDALEGVRPWCCEFQDVQAVSSPVIGSGLVRMLLRKEKMEILKDIQSVVPKRGAREEAA